MKTIWFYLGIIMACSGVPTIPGIILIVMYFWEDIKRTIEQSCNNQNLFGRNTSDPKFYDDETAERMK